MGLMCTHTNERKTQETWYECCFSFLVGANKLLESVDAELLANGFGGCNVLLVLRLVLDLVLDTFVDANGGGEVVDASGSLEGGGDDLLVGHQVVGKAVVQASLELEEVVYAVKELGICSMEGRVSADGKDWACYRGIERERRTAFVEGIVGLCVI